MKIKCPYIKQCKNALPRDITGLRWESDICKDCKERYSSEFEKKVTESKDNELERSKCKHLICVFLKQVQRRRGIGQFTYYETLSLVKCKSCDRVFILLPYEEDEEP